MCVLAFEWHTILGIENLMSGFASSQNHNIGKFSLLLHFHFFSSFQTELLFWLEQIHMSSTFGTYKLEDRVATCAQKS